jgi:L-lysine exporter family protein LysE/ArgO
MQGLPEIAKGVLIGLGAAVPIGPVNVEIARRTLRGGWAAGVALGLGAVSVDVTYAVLSTLSLGRLFDHAMVRWPVTIGGIILLSYLGVQCLRTAWSTTQRAEINDASSAPPSHAAALRSGYLLGLLMTFLNPMTLMFWFVALPTISAGTIAVDGARPLMFLCVGVFTGTIGWVLTFTATLALLGQFRRDLWLLLADTAGGVTLLTFALAAFLRSIGPLL